jgi:hypothetical protein
LDLTLESKFKVEKAPFKLPNLNERRDSDTKSVEVGTEADVITCSDDTTIDVRDVQQMSQMPDLNEV